MLQTLVQKMCSNSLYSQHFKRMPIYPLSSELRVVILKSICELIVSLITREAENSFHMFVVSCIKSFVGCILFHELN